MNVGDAAQRSGLPAKTIRYYEEIGLISPSRAGNGYRDYSGDDIHRLAFLRRARNLGFSIDDCRQLMALYQDRGRASQDVREIAAAPMLSGYVVSNLKNYENIGFVFPKDPGPVLVRDMVCQVANSPEPELAKMFIDMALSVETQTAYAKDLHFGPTNSKVTLTSQEAEGVISTPEQVKTLLQLDWPYIIANRPAWTDRWNKEILGQ